MLFCLEELLDVSARRLRRKLGRRLGRRLRLGLDVSVAWLLDEVDERKAEALVRGRGDDEAVVGAKEDLPRGAWCE